MERCIRYALERQRLHEQLQDKAQRLQALAGQLNQAEQRERSRIARLLHDHLQQILVSAKMHVEGLTKDNFPQQRQRVEELLDQVMQVSRTLTVELSPPILMDAGLAPALGWLAHWMKDKHDLKLTTDIDPEAEPADESVRLMLFHAVRELLFNVVKHADTNEAQLTMALNDNQVCITISDHGVGFEPSVLQQAVFLTHRVRSALPARTHAVDRRQTRSTERIKPGLPSDADRPVPAF